MLIAIMNTLFKINDGIKRPTEGKMVICGYNGNTVLFF